VSVELVLVYYNPLPDKASIIESIHFPSNSDYLSVRLVTVPSEIHTAFLTDEKVLRKPLPVLEFIGKNVGIRRASAPFILSTNADILLDDRLFEFINTSFLDSGFIYRADRFDFCFEKDSLKMQIKKVYLKMGQFRILPKPFSTLHLFFVIKISPFIIGYFRLIAKFRFLEKMRKFILFYKKDELFLFRNHYHACGDFTLLHKSVWEKLRGYPENTYSAMHTDSLLMSAALVSGVEEKILSFPVYHQQHSNTFEHNASDFYEDIMFKRLISDSNQMFQEQKPLLFNDENWGLANIKLEEIRIL